MNITDIINSKSKVVCLQIIAGYSEPIHLRRIVNLSGLQPRSIQLALHSLKELRVLKTRKNKNRIEYSLNTNSMDVSRLLPVIENLNAFQKNTTPDYKEQFLASIQFIDQARCLLNNIKTTYDIS
jgi:hypothetical protein